MERCPNATKTFPMRWLSLVIVGYRWEHAHCYIRQRSWANVMYSSPFVCLSVCLFVTFRNLRFSESILVTAVCLFVCLSVCLSVCPSSKALQAAPLVRSSWFFLQKMSSRHATMQNFFVWQSDEGQGQGHHFCENQIMAITFEPEVTETSGWLQNVPYIIPLLSGTLRFDVHRHVFRSRDFTKICENHIMGHNFWTGSGRDLWLADKCSL